MSLPSMEHMASNLEHFAQWIPLTGCGKCHSTASRCPPVWKTVKTLIWIFYTGTHFNKGWKMDFTAVTIGLSNPKLTVGTARANPAFVPLHSLEIPSCKAYNNFMSKNIKMVVCTKPKVDSFMLTQLAKQHRCIKSNYHHTTCRIIL